MGEGVRGKALEKQKEEGGPTSRFFLTCGSKRDRKKWGIPLERI